MQTLMPKCDFAGELLHTLRKYKTTSVSMSSLSFLNRRDEGNPDSNEVSLLCNAYDF